VLLTDFEEVTAGIERWEDLCAGGSRGRAWSSASTPTSP
jgi:hypothetical protein